MSMITIQNDFNMLQRWMETNMMKLSSGKFTFLLLDSKGNCAIAGWGVTELDSSSCD